MALDVVFTTLQAEDCTQKYYARGTGVEQYGETRGGAGYT